MSESPIESIRRWKAHPSQFVQEVFKVTPDPWQHDVLEAFPYQPRQAMTACKGPGKLQDKAMILDTPDGKRRWGDLTVGDSLFALDGSVTRIVATHENGLVPLYRITFDDGSSTLCGGDHLWRVAGRTERRHGQWATLTTLQIMARGVTVPNGRWRQKQFIIPRQGAAQYRHAAVPLDPYVAGVWLGDGSRGRPIYTKPYKEIEIEINRRGYNTCRKADGGTVLLVGAKDELQRFEAFKTASPNRFVPEAYRHASIHQRTDLLCGLMDTDGCIGKDGHMEYASTSLRLAQDVVWLVRSLGGVALIKEAIKEGWYYDGEERIECHDCYRVTVVLPFNPFRIGHKAERWQDPLRSRSTERYLTRFIASIEVAGVAESMCVEIDHPSRCYLANDFIVTHNSATLSWMGWNFLVTRVDARGAALSITADTLRDTLWAEFGTWYAKAPLLQAYFQLDAERITSKERPKTWWLSARSYPRSANPSDQAVALQGLHGEHVLLLLDEAGGIPRSILATAEAVLAGGGDQHIVLAGNPNNQDSALGQAVLNQRHLWHVTEITGDPDDPKRASRVSIEWARQQIEAWGRDNPWVLVNVFGRFPPSGLNTLLTPDEVRDAQKRHFQADAFRGFPLVLGVDVGRFGDDESVIFPRRAKIAYPPLRMRNLDSIQGASHVSRMAMERKADSIQIDATGGYGAGWYDGLKALGHTDALAVQFGGKAHEDRRFLNKRAEIIWLMCEWIKDGGALPPVAEMVIGLSTQQYTYTRDGRIQIEEKDQIKARLGRSPDLEDALACTFAYPVHVPRVNVLGLPESLSALIEGRLHQSGLEDDPFARYAREIKDGDR